MQTHWLARAVLVHDGHVLAIRPVGGSYTFLPGGHVETEIAESFETALVRELGEELGVVAAVGRYLGAIAWRWPEDDVTNYEMNHVFAVTVPETAEIVSREEHLECVWLSATDFDEMNLQPEPLRPLLAAYLAGSADTWWIP